jgi:hypothetical protein
MSSENGSSAVLDIDLDDIDDKEFDIPPIDKAPTLESILNAPDDDAALTDNVISATLFQAAGAVCISHSHFSVDYILAVARRNDGNE